MIPLKSEEDLRELMRSGAILACVMHKLKRLVKAGVTTLELDKQAGDFISQEAALPAFKGYRGFPANICISVNDEIVHGVPGPRKLKEGDIVSLDLGVNYKGYFTDAALTVAIGKISPQERKLIQVTRQALLEGVSKAVAGNRISDISSAIQSYVEKNGFSVVRQFVGHGIGKALHEEPEIPNFGLPQRGELIKNGMVFAIEPMVNMGSWEARILDNGWTAVTQDASASAHFEYTVAVTQKGPQVLTQING